MTTEAVIVVEWCKAQLYLNTYTAALLEGTVDIVFTIGAPKLMSLIIERV